jgi:hypothetical protein
MYDRDARKISGVSGKSRKSILKAIDAPGRLLCSKAESICFGRFVWMRSRIPRGSGESRPVLHPVEKVPSPALRAMGMEVRVKGLNGAN